MFSEDTLMEVNSIALSKDPFAIVVTEAGISTEPEQLECVVTELLVIVMLPEMLQSIVPLVPL